MNRFKPIQALILCFLCLECIPALESRANELSNPGLHVIPYPQEVETGGQPFRISRAVVITLDKNASVEDRFTARQLAQSLKEQHGIDATVSREPSRGAILLTRKGSSKHVGEEGYQISVSPEGIVIRANASAGLFYGAQTLVQLVRKEGQEHLVPGIKITDWPDIRERAVHYDTKHHQDNKEYVESFIRDLARYKINMLVWEWEDKVAYTSHPEIGAPGAFTIAEMQEFTRYARQYHIELVPLVQGLGHVSFILKWPQFAHLREIASSNWEFCPLKEGSYDLLFDLWQEAIRATPGSRYIHIGSDETYELAMCDACKAKAKEIGKSGLYTLFINKASKHLKTLGREVMAWEPPMGWVKSASPAVGLSPEKNIVLTESYDYEEPEFKYAAQAKQLGYKVFAYDPNPGIEHLFLPYFFKKRGDDIVEGSLQESYSFLTSTAESGVFHGMISTSWDDSGLHNQVWMLRFATAAAFSWNGSEPALDEFRSSYFKNYYGQESRDVQELFGLLNEGAFYFMSTLERNVWHHGVIGKTHLPDLPRGDALEYDPYWNEEYGIIIKESEKINGKMQRAHEIIDANLGSGVRHPYDFEVFASIAKLILHTTEIYRDLSTLEQHITHAHRKHFESHQQSYHILTEAATLIENCLKRRQNIFDELVATWEKTRLPKGLSTKEKKYFFRQDRARHFANRAPDMTYLILDEQQLDLEGYLHKLKEYISYYRKTYLAQE